jgi:CMP-N,N'-diacetyllegionaminic acid synthase
VTPYAVGIIHARGGSKRVPLKNVKLLGGKPLIAWVVEAACRATRLSRVIVSTDHDEIARLAVEYGAEVPFRRPADLAEDVASELVTQHAVRMLEAHGPRVDIPVTIQPTTPFLRPEHIDACVAQVADTGADSALTVSAVRERPEWMLRVGADGRAEPYVGRWWAADEGVSQSLPRLYSPNGGAYATRRDVLMERNTIVGPHSRIVEMPLEQSLDIDEAIDFVIAEAILCGQSGGSDRH